MAPRVLVLEANADLRIVLAMTLRNAVYECEVACLLLAERGCAVACQGVSNTQPA